MSKIQGIFRFENNFYKNNKNLIEDYFKKAKLPHLKEVKSQRNGIFTFNSNDFKDLDAFDHFLSYWMLPDNYNDWFRVGIKVNEVCSAVLRKLQQSHSIVTFDIYYQDDNLKARKMTKLAVPNHVNKTEYFVIIGEAASKM